MQVQPQAAAQAVPLQQLLLLVQIILTTLVAAEVAVQATMAAEAEVEVLCLQAHIAEKLVQQDL